MLDRIKRRHFDGFKEFVLNMETTGSSTRQQILMAGLLEDPVFMSYVMKNLRTFDDFLSLPTEEIDTVLLHQEQLVGVFAKCIFGLPEARVTELGQGLPKLSSRIKDELSYLKEVNPAESEGAKYYLLKVVRKLQMEEAIQGFQWKLPPQDLFHARVMKDGITSIFFETGVLAAEGEVAKGKRCHFWKHYYDTGKIMAEGEYVDGLKVNNWTYYFGNGKTKSKGRYKSDLKQGIWQEWDRSGGVTEIEYNEGVKV